MGLGRYRDGSFDLIVVANRVMTSTLIEQPPLLREGLALVSAQWKRR